MHMNGAVLKPEHYSIQQLIELENYLIKDAGGAITFLMLITFYFLKML
jgi:hypothetical protein